MNYIQIKPINQIIFFLSFLIEQFWFVYVHTYFHWRFLELIRSWCTWNDCLYCASVKDFVSSSLENPRFCMTSTLPRFIVQQCLNKKLLLRILLLRKRRCWGQYRQLWAVQIKHYHYFYLEWQTVNVTMDILHERFISHGYDQNWPPISCDLTHLNNIMWDFTKSHNIAITTIHQ